MKRHGCDPIYHEPSLLLILSFQHESLSELVCTQQTQILALRDCQDVIDLTLDSDSEDSMMPVEFIMKVESVRNMDFTLDFSPLFLP